MSNQTLKAMLDAVLLRSGLNEQAQYFNSNSVTLPAIANEVVAELVRMDWPVLRRDGSITMTSATLYDMPSDMAYIISDTMNADGQERHIALPTGTTEFWYFKTHQPTGLRYKVRFRNGQLEVLNPDDGIDLRFEYITQNVVIPDGPSIQSSKQFFTVDTDTCLLDDELLIKAIKWRNNMTRGVEGWERDKMLYDEYLKTLRGQVHGGTTLSFGEGPTDINPEPYTNLYI